MCHNSSKGVIHQKTAYTSKQQRESEWGWGGLERTLSCKVATLLQLNLVLGTSICITVHHNSHAFYIPFNLVNIW